MLRYVLRRLALLVPMAFIISIVVFVAMRMIPVDPGELVLGPWATAEQRELARQKLGLDQSIPVQYLRYVTTAFQGDLGRSIKSGKEVTELIRATVPNSLMLGGTALALAYLIAIPLGVVAAVRQNTLVDQGAMGFALIGISIPNFWLGLLLVLVFAVNLRWLPATGSGTAAHLILPAVTLGLQYTAIVARMTRSSVLEVLRQDFVRTLHAKGLRRGRIIYMHVLKNAVIPVISLLGLHIGGVVGGAVIVETIFAWPGMGALLVNSIIARDYPIVQAVLTLLGVAVLLANLLADVLYAAADRRIKM
ncbi:MAG: ABC transporter permease [Acetobacteraceae bacterium]|nr:ABC transporter permease [Acetobacteraceae bacterium]